MITQVSVKEVLTASRDQLGIPQSSGIDETLLASMLRRAAGIHCPCSLATLTGAVAESLQHLADEKCDLAGHIDETAEALIVIGDLLELHQVTIDDPNAKGTWVFSAPPGFIVRPSGSIFLLGIVPDEATPLPSSLSCRLQFEGVSRILVPAEGEALPAVFRELGLREVSASAWLKAPKTESAAELRDNMIRRLSEQPPSGMIADISILDSSRSVNYYPHRWITPARQSGQFVARRPQAYGAPLWGFAQLEDGTVTKFLDFPPKGTRWRGCDTAWHLQMAIDSCHGTSQKYRRRPGSGGGYLDFFSPIPQWTHRRLSIVGRAVPREHCLFSYWIPEREFPTEEENIQQNLWLTATDS